jgi:uncharacterized protein
MSSYNKEFYDIYNEFYQNNKYKELRKDVHHGLSKLKHIERVAKYSFYVSKFCKMDYVSATRGAFLHDFFLNTEVDKSNFKSYLESHADMALKNSEENFILNNIERDVISKHMYPISKSQPEYKESLVVSICDKVASIYEFFRYQLKMTATVTAIFIINVIKL